ncbi:uncharacterized protein F5891DRAFT_220969 [Suillus fuscotomentosus]|uniref:RING-type domain-containing protein n=1 Tax=Suillus fuscotomentosus TaxID=1912939 RepID=A0AAD4EKN3_9AGAM|nr:uncharacterized protein F5891DRAFT_220969 [Suillus fuscotomentosus]KAG1907958.1 hypothetical protein F5891DRAFT_220969 [Suillus fuscotomentosus]
MAECGICLEDIKKPVCIPCGHVHCEKCLRAHINSGNDALKSSCPSCRGIFHIAMPDLSFVPKKYHDFMVPCVRKLYLDIASPAPLVAEIEQLKTRVAALSRDRDALMERCEAHMAASRQYATNEKDARLEAKAAREATSRLQVKYDALEREFLDHSFMSQTSPDGRKRKGRESVDNSRISFFQEELVTESDVKLEELPDVLDFAPSRLKRALPRSSVASSSQRERSHDPPPRFVKRQRRARHSDIGPELQTQMPAPCEGCEECHGIYSQ